MPGARIEAERLLVAEYACSGAVPIGELPTSIVTEGRAMLRAAAADLAELDGREVDVLLADSLRDAWDVPGTTVVTSAGKTFGDRLRSTLAPGDAAFVVAPEFDGLLAEARAAIDDADGRWIGCTAEAIAIAGDKWRTFTHLATARVPTLPSCLDEVDAIGEPPWIVKPRDGAGSLGVRVIESRRKLRTTDLTGRLVQPLIPGRAVSVGVVFSPSGRAEVLPAGEQRFGADTVFEYTGGVVPIADDGAIHRLVAAAVDALPGLGGFVGFDVLVPDDAPDRPMIVEINPRLTTAYLGYRALAEGNLLARLLDEDAPVAWRHGSVRFDADGRTSCAR